LHSIVAGNHGLNRTSPVGNQATIKSPSKEPCKEELQSSTYEPPRPRSPSILYTPKDVTELRQHPGYSNCDLFTFEELKVATKHFRPDLIIGEGGFGAVYRGVIDETVRPGFENKEVAIKQLNRNGFQGDKEWLVIYLKSPTSILFMHLFVNICYASVLCSLLLLKFHDC